MPVNRRTATKNIYRIQVSFIFVVPFPEEGQDGEDAGEDDGDLADEVQGAGAPEDLAEGPGLRRGRRGPGSRASSFFMTRTSMAAKTTKKTGKAIAAALDSAAAPPLVRAMVSMKRTVMRPATTEISKTPAYGAFIRKKMMPSRRLADGERDRGPEEVLDEDRQDREEHQSDEQHDL